MGNGVGGARLVLLVVVVASVVGSAPPCRAASGRLPADVEAVIREEYAAPDAETRYRDGTVDLNDDGQEELVVHVVGPMACGSGGCSTMVFTPTASGWRLVATIAVTRTPIGVSTTTTEDWRNLIVRVSGGGTRARDVELRFDGTSYPSNPTVPGPRVETTTAQHARIVIAEITAFEDATLLPSAADAPAPAARARRADPDLSTASAEAPASAHATASADAPGSALPTAPADRPASAKPAASAKSSGPAKSAASANPPALGRPNGPAKHPSAAVAAPSFDCTKASVPVEKLVCGDRALAALDRALDAAYVDAMQRAHTDVKTAIRAAQRKWIAERNGCAEARDVKGCVAKSYERRLAEVQPRR